MTSEATVSAVALTKVNSASAPNVDSTNSEQENEAENVGLKSHKERDDGTDESDGEDMYADTCTPKDDDAQQQGAKDDKDDEEELYEEVVQHRMLLEWDKPSRRAQSQTEWFRDTMILTSFAGAQRDWSQQARPQKKDNHVYSR